MDFFKKIYFEARYFAKRIRPTRPIILMYHRVADDKNDPHLLCVSPENFRKHLEILKQKKNIIPLSKILDKNIPKNSVAITFDDGYADNLHTALPILKELSAPATIFIATGLLGQRFHWDDKQSSGRAISEVELKSLAIEPLVEIGSHTMTHPHLSELSRGGQKEEIEKSKKVLESIIGEQILSFAYPFGDLNQISISLVKEARYKIACAVRAESVREKSDPFSLPRFIVRNWDQKKFEKKINIFK